MKYWRIEISHLLSLLKTRANGLTSQEVKARWLQFGPNQLIQETHLSLLKKIIAQFTDLFVVILLIAGFLSVIFSDYRNAAIMFLIVLLNGIIGFSQEYKAEKTLKALAKLIPSFAKVLRGGVEQPLLTKSLVPGDIIYLEAGDDIPADGRLLEAYELKTNDFSLTGESQPQIKKAYLITTEEMSLTDIDNMVFMGTSVATGTAKAVVVATGMKTEFGRIAQKTSQIKEELSPLQIKLRTMAKLVAQIAIIILLLILTYSYFTHQNILQSFVYALALAAAVVPEGLPAAVTVALALGASRLSQKKALVKKLASVESLGSTTVICTDKTGTLTKNEITVQEIYVQDHPFSANGFFEQADNLKNDIAKIALLCNNAGLAPKLFGDPTEIALLKLFKDKINLEDYRQEFRRLTEFPFDSRRRMMSVIIEDPPAKDNTLLCKGSPHEILAACRISDQDKKKILAQNDLMASRGLRVLALAWKKVPELDYHLFHDYEMEKDLEFVALMGMIDQPRDEVAQAISSCHRAGIRVIMITGDYGLTAKAIAVKIGMDIEAKVVTGQELIAISDIKLREALQHEVIFARVNPTDKLRIVEQLKKMGEIVAVTGDGVNDAPALKRADIGIAMGLVGTDVARESADMILLDDNFATIVRAIKEGRIIFHNLKKTIFYVFASNAGELMTVVFGAIFGWVPILAVQILAVDLGTDVLPSLALGIDPGEKGIMNESPHNPKEKLLTLAILKRLLLVGFIMGLGAIFNYFRVKNSGGSYFEATASAYTTLVLCQIVNAYSIRHERDSIWKIGLFSNRLLIQAEIISFLLLLMIIYFPPIQRYMGTGPFHLIDWLYLLIVPVIFLVVEEIRKHYLRVQARNQRTKDLMAVLKTSQ